MMEKVVGNVRITLESPCMSCRCDPPDDVITKLISSHQVDCDRCGERIVLQSMKLYVSGGGWAVASSQYVDVMMVNSRAGNAVSSASDHSGMVHQHCWKEAFPVLNTNLKLKGKPS